MCSEYYILTETYLRISHALNRLRLLMYNLIPPFLIGSTLYGTSIASIFWSASQSLSTRNNINDTPSRPSTSIKGTDFNSAVVLLLDTYFFK